MAQTPPDEARSGKGTLAKFKAVDDLTLKMTFDAPAPLTADRMAMWVNGNIGKNGPIWMMPSHYLKQFHPKYGKNVPDNWDTVGGLMEHEGRLAPQPRLPDDDRLSSASRSTTPRAWCWSATRTTGA